MEIERRVVSAVASGDLVALDDTVGWQLVDGVSGNVEGVCTLTLSSLIGEERSMRTLPADAFVRRAEPGALHDAAEFVGLPVDHAEIWAASLGWAFRDISRATFVTDDWRHDRVNVWTGEDGRVVRAELY